MQLVIAEKPSVARDLARVLGVRPNGKGSFEGDGRVITWCIGHLVELDEPASYDERWKSWRLDTLPMLPSQFKLRPTASTTQQFHAVKSLLCDRRFTEVVNACDAGREGELIFRYVYQLAGSTLPIRRLWISSLTDEAIREGVRTLRPGTSYEALADAARCRSEADWLVGMNATRAVTIRGRSGPGSTLYSIGRVQTPTLAIVVTREKAIRQFAARAYWEVGGTFRTETGEQFTATWSRRRTTRLATAALADTVAARDGACGAAVHPDGPRVESVRQKTVREQPPLLFDLTSLQRTANRRFGFSATRTLEIAQALYETHMILTYPRTSSRHLSNDMVAEMPKLLRCLAPVADYAPFASELLQNPPRAGKRVFDDAKVQDHHAIVPTGKAVRLEALDVDERRIFDLVARRFLGIFFPEAVFAVTDVAIRVGAGTAEPLPVTGERAPTADDGAKNAAPEDVVEIINELPPPPDRFVARGRVRLEAGWQAVAGFGGDDGGKDGDAADGPGKNDGDGAQTLPVLHEGDPLDGRFAGRARKTKAPPHYTEATLLAAMEGAGRHIDDEELRLAMKDCGLGTPATRAATIETLVKRGFVERQKKQLVATPMGMSLVDALPVKNLASPELTGDWEARLARVARGEERREAFMVDIARYVSDVVQAVRTSRPPEAPPVAAKPPATPRPASRKPRAAAGTAPADITDLRCPHCKQGGIVTGHRGWGCSRWREGCGFVVWFETAGKRLTPGQFRELVTRGHTRKGKWTAPSGTIVTGRLVLEPGVSGGAARFEVAEPAANRQK